MQLDKILDQFITLIYDNFEITLGILVITAMLILFILINKRKNKIKRYSSKSKNEKDHLDTEHNITEIEKDVIDYETEVSKLKKRISKLESDEDNLKSVISDSMENISKLENDLLYANEHFLLYLKAIEKYDEYLYLKTNLKLCSQMEGHDSFKIKLVQNNISMLEEKAKNKEISKALKGEE